MYITHEQRFIEPHILYVDTDDIFVFYLGADRQAYIATKTSLFEVNNVYATAEFRGISLSEIAIGARCMIDNVEVSRQTFEKVRDLLQTNTIYGDGKRADSVYFDEFYHNERENADMRTISDTRTNSEKSIDSIIEDCERLSMVKETLNNININQNAKIYVDNSHDILPANPTWYKFPNMDMVLYKDITGELYIAKKDAILETLDVYTYAEGNFMHPKKVIIGHKYHIDENAVTKETFNMVKEMLNNINQNGKVCGKRAECSVIDEWCGKDDFTMPNITSYNFYPKQGTTKLTFDDGTTTVVQPKDPETADVYTGFVSAIAKRAMGNKGGMLKAYHKFVEQPEIDKKLAEEKAKREAEEEKIRTEKERKREERETIESLAQSYKEDYDNEQELVKFRKQLEQAKKLAHDKYGVPYEYFDRLNCCEDCCEDCGECDCHNTYENTVTDNSESTQSEF